MMETNIKTFTVNERTFQIPAISAFTQLEIFYTLYPYLNHEGLNNAKMGIAFNDDILLRTITNPSLKGEIREIEKQLTKDMREKKGSKFVYADIESFRSEIYKTYIPLIIEILKHNFEDFFYSLANDINAIIQKIQQPNQE